MPTKLPRSPEAPAPPALLPALLLVAVALSTAGCAFGSDEAHAATAEAETVLSPTYTVDRIYRSMTGPYSTQEVVLGEAGESELMWITGYRAVMVGPDGETEMPQEFMCHSNLDVDVGEHRKALPASGGFNERLFTLSQGQLEIEFPAGYGIPVMSNQPLDLTTQVLNLNHPEGERQVRHKISLQYVRDDEPGTMRPLFPIAAFGMALLEGDSGHYGIDQPDAEQHGPGCLTGGNASDSTYSDPLGRTFTGHWVVPPGRQVNHTLVTHLMQVPYETTIHYIAVHLHPFAESLSLNDLTTGETLFASRAENFPDKIGLARVDSFSSVEGIRIYPDHEYELVSVYDNVTAEPQDSMAVMYIYLRDQELERALEAGLPAAPAR